MKQRATLMAALGVVVVTAACGVQHEGNIVAPTANPAPRTAAPTPAPPATSTTPSIVGLWTSNTAPTASLPDPSTCGNFQFQVTTQTSTSVAGIFSGSCGTVLNFSGHVSGQPNGTAVKIDATGSATGVPGFPRCSFTVTANGNIEESGYALPLSFNGMTCLGPVTGHETLRRPAAPAPPPPPPPSPTP